LDSREFPSKAKALDSRQFLGTPRKLSDPNKVFSRAQDKWRGWTLRTRKGGNYGYQAILDIRQQNRTVASIERGSTDGYAHRSYTFTPDGERIISGGGMGVITAYNRDGNKLGDFVGHTGDVWAVAVSSDGRLLASGSGDQTVRLWDVESRENLLTLFHGFDGEWVAWTPTGHYTASVNGDKMVGWQINRGVDKVADYVEAAQLYKHLHRPDVINAAIRLRSVKKAIAQTGAHFNLARLQRELPPRFQIISPHGGSKMKKDVVPVVLKIAENILAIQRFEVYVNGRQVTPQKVRKINPIITQHERTLEVPLETGKNRITIRAINRLAPTNAEVTVHYDGPSQIGALHLVSIGVSAYPHLSSDKQLDFAAIDAQAFSNTLTKQAKKSYRQINPVVLSDNEGKTPTKANIEKALQALPQAKSEDTTILFLAGHGVNIGKDYYFLPKDTRQRGDKLDTDSMVSWQVLKNAIANSQGRRILLIDTCHAGNAFNQSDLLTDVAKKNIIVLSATDANSVSIEKSELGHGVFTYALLEGLKGRADLFPDGGKIKFKELDTYVSSYVAQLTDNRQKTVSQASSQEFEDFVFVQL
jgi:hypothetical protein